MAANTRGTETMHIGELADRTGLSLRTIRHYDDVGLLPASARSDGGFRVYTESDAARLMVIKQMKPLGFSLEEMAEILGLLAADDAAGEQTGEGAGDAGPAAHAAPAAGSDARLAEFLERAEHQRAKMARNLGQADEFIAMLGNRSA